MKTKLISTLEYLLLIDEVGRIKPEDLVYDWFNDQIRKYEDIGTGRKIVAYYPLTKEAKELDLPVLPDFKSEYTDFQIIDMLVNICKATYPQFEEWIEYKEVEKFKTSQQSNKQFSLEDMKKAFNAGFSRGCAFIEANEVSEDIPNSILKEEDYIKSLSTQQLPKEFIPEYEIIDGYTGSTCLECGQVDNHDETEDELCTGCHKIVEWKHNYGESKTILKTITNSEGKLELVGTYKY